MKLNRNIVGTGAALVAAGLAGLVLVGCEEKSTSDAGTQTQDLLGSATNAAGNAMEKTKQVATETAAKVQNGATQMMDAEPTSVSDFAAKSKDDAVTFFEPKIADAGTKLEEWKKLAADKASSLSAEAKPAVDSALKSAETHLANVKVKFAELKDAAPEKWSGLVTDVKTSLSSFWESGKTAAQNLAG